MTVALAPVLVIVMGQSALRSLLLGALVFAGLRLARARDLRAETHIWTAVLAAALVMPLLAALLPGVPLPALGTVHPATAGLSAPAAAGRPPLASPGLILTGVYLLGTAFALLRILAGLVLVALLYVRAEPIAEPWARGRAIRASAAVDGPLSFARCIVLPADYAAWPETKLAAVLAHEECHVRRGDFFIQLLASAHRALFWFSPFPWWLQRKLGELAETASDAAGARRIGDPARYAEILVDVTRAARRRGLLAREAMAMAHGPGLARRVDHLLSLPPERTMGAALAQGGAGSGRPVRSDAAQAADQPGSSSPHARALGRRPPSRAARRGAVNKAAVAAAKAAAQPAAVDPDQPTYDPLAALRDHDTVAALPVILAGHGLSQ